LLNSEGREGNYNSWQIERLPTATFNIRKDKGMKRRFNSIKKELLLKSRESALAAVQVFNNPLITFKSEMFIVNMHIAWTYLLHAYYRQKQIEYRYVKSVGPSGKRTFDKTKNGAYKFWSLEDCLNCQACPIDNDAANNLRFLIGLRHEIEHQMTTKIDDLFSARFQACCINFNDYIKTLFGEDFGIDHHLAFSLQFSALSEEQISAMSDLEGRLPSHINRYIENFDASLTDTEYQNTKFSYRVIFTQKIVNHKGQADKVIEFVKSDSEVAKGINETYAVIREKEKVKYRPSTIILKMQESGYPKFKQHQHYLLWKNENAKDPARGYGIQIENQWYWYDSWLKYVKDHCSKNKRLYV
jgi:hypothetical protein